MDLSQTAAARGRPTGQPGLVLFLLSAALWIGSLIADWALHSDSLSCELAPGSSIYGQAGWSWLPLGHTCTWVLNDGRILTQGPSMLTMLPPIILALWGLSLFLFHSATPSSSGPAEQTRR